MTISPLDNILSYIVNPAVKLLFGLALLYFFYGLVVFMYDNSNGKGNLKEGKDHVLWGIVGLFIMVSVFGILQLICGTVQCN